MYKGRRDENAGAEVTGEEEEMMGHRETGKAANYDRKGACCDCCSLEPTTSLDQVWEGKKDPD